MMGDSDFELDERPEIVKEFMIKGVPGIGDAYVELSKNEHGRVGSLFILIDAIRTRDAYSIAQTAFNRIAVSAAVMWGIPLHQDGIQITRFTGDHTAPVVSDLVRVTATSYPIRPALLALDFSRLLRPLYTSYAEGLRSNSPFYAFLCFFTLTEFITGHLQGRLRRLSRDYPIDYADLKGALTKDDVRYLGFFAEGLTYDDLLKQTRDIRNSVAHLIFEIDKLYARPFNVDAEDHVSFYRDALKIASRDLMSKVESNVERFKSAGASEEVLWNAFTKTVE